LKFKRLFNGKKLGSGASLTPVNISADASAVVPATRRLGEFKIFERLGFS
jgi:hypothetical protein